jgi:hypothetical protein
LLTGDERAFVNRIGVGDAWRPMNRQSSSSINFSKYIIIIYTSG